jgi:hypothetical protein
MTDHQSPLATAAVSLCAYVLQQQVIHNAPPPCRRCWRCWTR